MIATSESPLRIAIVDTSCIVAIALGERAGRGVNDRFTEFDRLFAAPLLEAELHSALRRELVNNADVDLSAVDWILPSRPLTEEVSRVLEAGFVRGADCCHLACALYLAPEPNEATFLTLDAAQRKVARALGFAT
jgi:predicted nucleic acid-binding protein